MDRQEAERIYDAGKEAVVETLLKMAVPIRELEKLEQRVIELEQIVARLTRNSSNSSRPPSSDPPGTSKAKKKPSRRKQGGQPGHKGKKRELLPLEEMDAIHNIFPQSCKYCSLPFAQEFKIPTPHPLRHQVFELPEIVPLKTEYRCHTLQCSCGCHTTASLPEEVARSEFGPRVHAAVAYLAALHRVSRRGIAEIIENFFNITIATGTICNAAERVSEACLPVVDTIKRYVASALALNIDETGWKYKGKRRYLWTFVSLRAILFHISPSRSAKVLKEILGEIYAGVITSDDHSAYSSYQKGLRQLCWAHLIRKLKALKEDRSSPHHAYCFAKNMLADIGAIFSRWHAFKNSGGNRDQLWRDTQPMRERMRDYCIIFRYSSDARVQTRTKRLLDNWHHLFTFLKYEGVEPTNNIAERAIRPAVQWRKICFGSQSVIGEQFTGRLLSVVRTCQIHGINAFDFLAKVVAAAFSPSKSLPSLPLALPN
jgi:transposase